jgi:hypothetical protein
MLLNVLNHLRTARPPFATVCLDATGLSRATGDDGGRRWVQQARKLTEDGVPAATVEALSRAATGPTGLGGEHARLVVASGSDVVLNLVLPGRPARDESMFGPVPQLMPVARAMADAVPYAVVRVDRSGADVDVVSATGDVASEEEVEGGHDVLHKVPSGGWSQRRYQQRVEDSWAHNAGAVADRLDRVVRRNHLELVLVSGDERAIAELKGRSSAEVADRLVVLDSGGRAAGTSAEAEQEAVRKALDAHREHRRRTVLDEFSEQLSRQQRAVEGLEPVVEALARGQVQRLVLRDDATSTVRLWVGESPQQIGMTREQVLQSGAASAEEVRADAALVWSLLGTDADISLVGDSDARLYEGIGALLRWSDPATRHLDAPSMPGHGQAPGGSENVE